MLLIRRFEEKVEERFRAGELPGFLHVAIGQEAVAVGVCQRSRRRRDRLHAPRARAHARAGTHPNALMAELYGKLEGCSHGYGGSMHLYDVERGNLGANAVVGGGCRRSPAPRSLQVPRASRASRRVLRRRRDEHRHLPRVAEPRAALERPGRLRAARTTSGPSRRRASSTRRSTTSRKRAVAYGMHSMKVDGQDVEAVYDAAREALEHARAATGRASSSSRRTASSATTSAIRRSTAEGGAQELARRRIRSRSCASKLGVSDEECEQLDAR
jgi:pyruvate dehydrogenase E1 component alpha subunit